MDSKLEVELLRRAQSGDRESLGVLVERYRDRLKRLISVRIDRLVKPRLDESDVLQEMYFRLDQTAKLDERAACKSVESGHSSELEPTTPIGSPPLTAYLWLRRFAIWTLADLQRKHLGVQQRDPRRELPLGVLNGTSSFDVAQLFVSFGTQPLDVIIRGERLAELQRLLDELDPLDREIIMLRHGEQLSRSEAAIILNISIAAAAKRYLRALQRIRSMMKEWET